MFLGLANLGVEIVQVVAQRMKHEASAPADAPTELHALVDAYDTTPRSLRRTELLVHKFAAPLLTPCHAGPRSEAARKPAVRRDVDSLDSDTSVDLSKFPTLIWTACSRRTNLLGAHFARSLRRFSRILVRRAADIDRYTSRVAAECATLGGNEAAQVATGTRGLRRRSLKREPKRSPCACMGRRVAVIRERWRPPAAWNLVVQRGDLCRLR
jgi:hypothetical protein